MNSIAAEIYANKRNQVDAELEKTEQMVSHNHFTVGFLGYTIPI